LPADIVELLSPGNGAAATAAAAAVLLPLSQFIPKTSDFHRYVPFPLRSANNSFY
jgi:hypothetical protein